MSAPHRGFPDYKPGPDTRPPGTHRLPWFIAGVGIPLLALALINAGPTPESKPATDPAPAKVSATAQTTAPSPEPGQETGAPSVATDVADTAPALTVSPAPPEPGEALTLTVRPGDSLDRLFARH
ncbi:MAG TPA: hypothetical protein ENK16_03880, partial [Chromatiales bacterium]|nr:hypothetical protein [Chromatiales bacterium]